MARPSRKTESAPDVKINQDALKEATQQADEATAIEKKHQLALVTTLGGAANLSVDQLWTEAIFFAESGARAMLEMGIRFCVLKEKLGHGNFTAGLEIRGFGLRSAQIYMAAALKFSGLKAQTSALLELKPSKFLELASLPDDELEALSEGGTVAGFTLEKAKTMTVRELRAALKDAEEDKTATETLLDEKQKENNKLKRELGRLPEIRPFGDRAKAISAAVGPCATATEEAVVILYQLMEQAITRLPDEGHASPEELASIRKSVEDAATRIRELSAALDKAVIEFGNNVPGLSAYSKD